MKSLIEKEQLLKEIARAGYFGKYEIYIRTDDPFLIPHFHICDIISRGEKFHTCIMITEARYFQCEDKNDVLTSKESNALNDFLSLPYSQDKTKTNWKHIVELWNDNNSTITVDLDVSMPNYTTIEKG